MAYSAADVNTRVEAAVAAIDLGDFSGAYTKLLGAEALLAGLPDSEQKSASLKWDRLAIGRLVERVKGRLDAGSSRGKVQSQKGVYVGLVASDED